MIHFVDHVTGVGWPPRRRAPFRAVLPVAAALAVAIGLAGCGSSTGQQAAATTGVTATATATMSGGVQVFHVTGLRTLQFSATELVAKAGRIRVEFSVESGSAPHNFVIPKIPAARTDVVSAGGSQPVEFTADKPGEYPVICTLHPNMTATLKII
jgi:plastocyanin